MTKLADVVDATAIRPLQVSSVPEAQLTELRRNPPAWLLLREARPQPQAIFVPDLIRYLESAAAGGDDDSGDEPAPLDLTTLPIQRPAATPISARADSSTWRCCRP